MMSLMILGPSFINAGALACECGTHATGIYTYNVGEGEECCSGAPGSTGFLIRYRFSEGIWQEVSRTKLAGEEVQNHCCTPS